MDRFLSEVASDLYNRYNSGVGELKILFPSRRARLFFTDALANIVEGAVWEPEWIAIDDMMESIAGVEVGERVRLIAELFRVYKKYHPNESFDRFYNWGEILLGDFDMVDKYMIDADMLFRNVADIKELESDLSYLNEHELRIVAFWSSIKEGELTLQKQLFLRVWQSLAPIYHDFRARLEELGFAYSGMVHRIAVGRLQRGEVQLSKDDIYVVAGFNALSECEKILLDELKSSTTTHFYWDWDNYYANSHEQEAGLFINDNRLRYPSAANISHNNLTQQKSVEVVACSSSALQCKYVAKILDDIVASGGVIDKRTAIVLTDESLLMPLLHALPRYVGSVNVTMGYPLRQSLAYSFVERLIALQSHARCSSVGIATLYHIDVVGLLSHPYLESSVDRNILRSFERVIREERLISVPTKLFAESEMLSQIFRAANGWCEISKYISALLLSLASLPNQTDNRSEERVEFLSFIADQILMLHNSIEMCEVELSVSTYLSLLRRHLQPLRIPFEGEPLEGLQVMGILETRSLDFENVIILSMSDDNFPGNRTQQPSYVPYNLRAAYNMPTPEHHDGVYAYYFYRLIQRSKRLWMSYCSCADDKSTGEQSRYITQLDFESPFHLKRIDVGVDVNLFEETAIEVKKEGVVAQQLRQFKRLVRSEGAEGTETEGTEGTEETVGTETSDPSSQKALSPTALFQYIACPLRFYFRSLARISEQEELSEEIDAPMFGTILHGAMQNLYEPLKGVVNMDRAIALIKDREITAAVDQAIRENYLKSSIEGVSEPLSGNLMIVREVVVRYIKDGVLRYDAANHNFEIVGNEEGVEHNLTLRNGESVKLWGICDRIDRLGEGALRVVDYKTGAPHLSFDGVDKLFNGSGKQRLSNIFQTLLYSFMLRERSGGRERITPALYYVRNMNQEDYSHLLQCCEGEGRGRISNPVDSYEPLHEEFKELLQATLEELFDLNIPFVQCEDIENTCAYCDYKLICRRKE